MNVALVTGASSGIGRETVRALLARGFRVHAAARRLDAMKDLEGAHLHHLDLTDPASIDACVDAVLAEEGRIDVLVNAAGYGAYGAVEDVPLERARAQMEVNLFGLAQIVQKVTPGMRTRRAGRIVNVSSIGGRLWSPMGAWYQASKFALEGFSDCLRNELRPFGVDVVVVQPGGVKTEWAQIAVENMRQTSGHGPYAPIVEQSARVYGLDSASATPESIARVIVRAATVKRPAARYVAPLNARVLLFLRWLLPDGAFDALWRAIFGLPRQLGA